MWSVRKIHVRYKIWIYTEHTVKCILFVLYRFACQLVMKYWGKCSVVFICAGRLQTFRIPASKYWLDLHNVRFGFIILAYVDSIGMSGLLYSCDRSLVIIQGCHRSRKSRGGGEIFTCSMQVPFKLATDFRFSGNWLICNSVNVWKFRMVFCSGVVSVCVSV